MQLQRAAVLGVPKIFMGESEGSNRATADIVMQEYVTRLRMLQEMIGDTLETALFAALIKTEFGEGAEVPECKWRPIWEPTWQEKAKALGDLTVQSVILPQEARTPLGFPEEYPEQVEKNPAPILGKVSTSQTDDEALASGVTALTVGSKTAMVRNGGEQHLIARVH